MKPAKNEEKVSLRWKGLEFWPVSNASELLFSQSVVAGDPDLVVIYLFLFLHLRRGGKNVVADLISILDLTSDKIKLRGALLEWLDSLGKLTEADKSEAIKTFDLAFGWTGRSKLVSGEARRRRAGK
jgi:hypothetical protein